MRDLGDGRDVLDDAEEVGRLHEHARGLIGKGGVQSFEIDAAVLAIAEHLLIDVLVLRVGGENLAVFGMNGLCDKRAGAASDANGHHHGLGCAG